MELYPGYLENHFNIHKLSCHLPLATGGAPGRHMTSASVRRPPMGIYDYDRRARQQPFPAWAGEPPFRADSVAAQAVATGAPPPAVVVGVVEPEVKFVSRVAVAEDDAPLADSPGPPSSDSFGHDRDDAGPSDKALRRLAQNREAARKSRLRKKAYIQALESSRMKLAWMEQELAAVRRQQGAFVGGSVGESAPTLVDSGVAAFEMEYARWMEEQARQAGELRAALQSDASELHLRVLVDAGLAHYDALFGAKSAAARRDAFFVLSGAWRAPTERFFLWIGGFRPSEVLKTLEPQLEPLAEQQRAEVRALQQTARQLEDALSQGLDKLQQTLTEALLATTAAIDAPHDGGGGYANVPPQQQMAGVFGRLDGLPRFVDQADHLRQQTLRNMRKILAPRQAARGLLALADYCQRLRALSSLWAARPREPA